MDKIIGRAHPLHGALYGAGVSDVALHHLRARTGASGQDSRIADKASDGDSVLLEPAQKPPADVAGRSGKEDRAAVAGGV
jgi:hypothetical protein